MLFSYYFRDDCCGFHQESLHDMDAKRQLLQHAKENYIRCAYKIQDQRSWWRGTSPLAFKLLWIHLIAGQIFLLTIHWSRQTCVIVIKLIRCRISELKCIGLLFFSDYQWTCSCDIQSERLWQFHDGKRNIPVFGPSSQWSMA